MKNKARPPSHRPPSRAPRVRPQCVRLSVDDRREKERERNRAYQKKYRERQRALVNDRHGRSNSITQQETPSYLPIHQKKAVDDFLNRLCCTENVPDICSICGESYHGMRLKGTQCERCSNEVCFFEPLFVFFFLLRFFTYRRTVIVSSPRMKQILVTFPSNCGVF